VPGARAAGRHAAASLVVALLPGRACVPLGMRVCLLWAWGGLRAWVGGGFCDFLFFNQQLTEQLTPMLEINNGTLFGW